MPSLLYVDDDENIGRIVASGGSMIVAGSAIFSEDSDVADAVAQLRQGIGR